MSNGCPIRVLRKVYKSWEDLVEHGILREHMFISDDEFRVVVENAEEHFGLNERDQYHELFWMDCKRLLGDEIAEKANRDGRRDW